MGDISALWILVLAVLAAALLITIIALPRRKPDIQPPTRDASAIPPSANPGENPDDPKSDVAAEELADGVAELLAATRSGGIVADRSGRVLRATSSALTFGLIRGRELSHPDLLELFMLVLGDGGTRDGEFESARGPVGQGRLVIGVRIAQLADGLMLMLIEDRTAARRVEEVRRDFVVNVSHELKTPVGGLSLLAEAVEGASDDPVAVRRFAGRMKVEAERLSTLVSEIVDLSRLQTADMLTELRVVDVHACASEAVEQTRVIAGERVVTSRAAGPVASLRVYGDAELITTAIRNLVTNAISYSEDRTRVSVVTRRVEDIVEIKVSDQGRGISVADQERIFERFYRVDAARSRMTGGTGLGLSIVKHICSNLGGEVRLWSQEGQGSTFTMRLPGIVDDERPVGSHAPADHRPAPRKVAI
ncbi:MAG: ATP-binding protein [Ornithinimicrobium sp.]